MRRRFFDFCSVTQRPRETPKEEMQFTEALQDMPRIYLSADAVATFSYIFHCVEIKYL